MKLDKWQQEVLKTKGNICLRSGRQVGKSTIISIKAGEYAVKHQKKFVLVIAAVERQAQLLFEKVYNYLYKYHASLIKKGKDRPTKHRIHLKNGSKIYCLPTGLSGYGIRGYTVDLLIADEAAFIPEAVWIAVTPMLASTKGAIWLLSTPHGKRGYFYRCFKDDNFKKFHISSQDCTRIDKKFLISEKQRMTKVQYAQEYLGEFVDKLMQFFPTELINKVMLPPAHFLSPYQSQKDRGEYYLGVDVARMGGDETVLYSLVKRKSKILQEVDLKITKFTRLTDTVRLILHKDQNYHYKKIYIDDGGLGVGVFDPLLEHEQTRRKVVAINNAKRSLDRDDKSKKKLLKEDLYNNLKNLMENGLIELKQDEETFLSLSSVQYEYEDGRLKIFGDYSHITEALVRAAWAYKDKSLNIYIY